MICFPFDVRRTEEQLPGCTAHITWRGEQVDRMKTSGTTLPAWQFRKAVGMQIAWEYGTATPEQKRKVPEPVKLDSGTKAQVIEYCFS